MKFVQANITTILTVLLVAVFTWNLRGCFGGSSKTYEMGKREAEIENLAQRKTEDSLKLIASDRKYDSAVAASNARIEELENKKIPIINAINKVRNTVPDYTKLQLANESAAYYEKYGN